MLNHGFNLYSLSQQFDHFFINILSRVIEIWSGRAIQGSNSGLVFVTLTLGRHGLDKGSAQSHLVEHLTNV